LGIVERLYRCFVECDAMLCEINPLIVTPAGEGRALDSKFTVDDSALFRHPDIAEMRDDEAANPQERFAREKCLTYAQRAGGRGGCSARASRCESSCRSSSGLTERTEMRDGDSSRT